MSPYKNKEQAKEYNKTRMRATRSVQPNVVQPKGTLLHRPNGKDYDPAEKICDHPYYDDDTPRYLGPLTDGQVLDRLTT